ncbi:hypothetical protein A3A76_04425 [Candidatus Woesebacteria bacterium RIFCSPLOWO2_01_FULL_39_23]|uniref:Recombinase domain-containing protein n=1 Tax=Candidatus Woesebacteria bacterium RIFCSPHIGHO2_01_FULL_40_22 TaxID=1802499 RepID=A0A1F7YF79_9BACT|nr:MAG: hypothetical protein A2628_00425 [Candidatus Woesebacteria bacterium RIFCSPHIGHO2_01_FULL_40_22]OGM61846.1 MAG: hypothetical protein A3A76_04425 [Candidatus Woesebacteria bacterium RIFCSPLOWO2_01_FULL_39_23]
MLGTYDHHATYVNEDSGLQKSKFIVAVYIRVSGESQAEKDKVSLDIQKKDSLNYANKQCWRVFKVYEDVLTGYLDFENRIGGKELLDDARQGKFNLVLLWDSDRTGRDPEALAAKLFRHYMRELGIQVTSLDQPLILKDPDEYKYDPYDEGQIFMETIHDLQSATTVSKFRRRSMESKQERARGGKMLNTPPYGYKLEPLRDENGNIIIKKDGRIVYKRVVQEKEKPIVLRIYHEYVFKGKSMNGIRDQLNAEGVPTRKGRHWERAMVARILKNPVYFGALIYNKYFRRKNALTGTTKMGKNPFEKWIVVPPGQTEHEAIIKKDLFDKAQEVRKAKLRLGSVAVYNDFLLSGLSKCEICGSKMYRTKVKTTYTRKSDGVTTKSQSNGYICGRWQRFRDTERNYISESELKSAVINDLKRLKDNPDVLKGFLAESDKKKVDDISSRLEFLRSNLSKIDSRYSRLRRAYEYGSLSMTKFNDAVDELGHEEGVMREQVVKLESQIKDEQRRELTREDFKQAINRFEEIFLKGDIADQKAFLRSLIQEIVVGNKKITINYLISR